MFDIQNYYSFLLAGVALVGFGLKLAASNR